MSGPPGPQASGPTSSCKPLHLPGKTVTAWVLGAPRADAEGSIVEVKVAWHTPTHEASTALGTAPRCREHIPNLSQRLSLRLVRRDLGLETLACDSRG